MEKTLVLIIPCFNEAETLLYTCASLQTLRNEWIARQLISSESKLLLVDDGSRDATWQQIEQLHLENPWICGLKLSRNFGHQNALLAGMLHAEPWGDVFVTLDADLQDDPTIIPEMLDAYYKGAEVVYGIRENRAHDRLIKRWTAKGFYQLMHWLRIPLYPHHADFRLFTRLAIQTLTQFEERNVFLRGLFPSLGFRTATVKYQRKERQYGISKYPLRKMIAFAWEGITSFSIYPVRLILYIGVCTFLGAILLGIWVIYTYLAGKAIPGWSSIILPIAAFGGIQMISLGIIGEYLGKIYQEVKKRPRFIVEKSLE